MSNKIYVVTMENDGMDAIEIGYASNQEIADKMIEKASSTDGFEYNTYKSYQAIMDYMEINDELVCFKETASDKEKWETKTIIATEADGLDVTTLVMVFSVKPGVNIENAVLSASTEYCLTEEGKHTYEGNCNSFNWGDFDTYVPNSICEKYGIRKLQSNVAEEFCFDQQLVNELEVFPEIEEVRAVDIMWDVDDDEDGSELPTVVIVPDEYALDSEYDEDSISEVVSDWLSDEYGFCHEGFKLVYLTGNDLKTEEEKLKRAVCDAGVNAVEDFLGHPLDSDDINIDSEMDDCIAGMPTDEYLAYLTKYVW